MSKWNAGDLAKTKNDGIVFRTSRGKWMLYDGFTVTLDHEPRPLVVIDPEDAEQVERLVRLDAAQYEVRRAKLQPEEISFMQAALREFANPTPPKPDEPQGLGAVVEDAEGRRWTNTHGVLAWHPQDGQPRRFADIPAVRVLSEGVTS